MCVMVNHLMNQAWRKIVIAAMACWLLCPVLQAQVSEPQNEQPAVQPVYMQKTKTPDVSDLAKDNYSRVAASSVDIRAVLVREAGLLVELKRWVAKEATDDGQIVEDADLTDQAIFDRLDRDVTFR